ncbi:MAG: DUF192 domain-containing protein, partial [Burkholderiaceae bacterium]
MIRTKLYAAAFTIALLVPGVRAQDAPQSLAAIRLNAGMHIIKAEVAQSPDQRAIGLMHRKSM